MKKFISVNFFRELIGFLFTYLAVKSGGYYMFEELDTEVCDLNYNTRESLIPDPEGDEIKNLAKSKGLSAVDFVFRIIFFVNFFCLFSFAPKYLKVNLISLKWQ